MLNRCKSSSVFLLNISLLFGGGKDATQEIIEELPEVSKLCEQEGLLEFFTDTEGNRIFIYENGETYLQKDEECQFEPPESTYKHQTVCKTSLRWVFLPPPRQLPC